MSLRSKAAGTLSGALVAGALLAVASPANAATDLDDTTFTPVAADLIGVGSDTSQNAVFRIANAFNTANPGAGYKVATFAATSGGTITLPGGAITRPNGSGAGKNLLYGPTNNVDVDFARSSSSLSTAEANAGLQQFPFALDELAMAVSNNVTSNAPASLTGANIVGIYSGTITNWSQIDPTKSGVIKPYIPQGGSGTRSFFVAQLKSLNGGTDVTLGSAVTDVQEHDDTLIKGDANAVAPFSIGRARLLGTTLRIEGGFKARRALYNVVRGTDTGDTKVQAVFGSGGYACSSAAKPLIEAAGFFQLASDGEGGVCGLQTQSPAASLRVTGQVDTTATATATSSAPGQVVLTANVTQTTGSVAPRGTVTFKEGSSVVGEVAVTGAGAVSRTLTGVTPGAHTYTASFVGETGFTDVTAPAASVTVAAAPAPATATLIDTAASSPSDRVAALRATVSPAAAGTVTFFDAGTPVAAVGVSGGVATATVAAAPGNHSYTSAFTPADAALFTASSDASPATVLVRTTGSVSETFKSTAKYSKKLKLKGTVRVALVGSATATSGTVVIKRGSKVVGTGTVAGGVATIKVKGLKKGTNKLVATWSGDTLAPAAALAFKVKLK